MDHKSLTAQLRPETKTGAARRLRTQGQIPAVVYGHDAPVAVSIEAREFHREFHAVSESTIIDLKLDKKVKQVLIKDYQEDITRGDILHIDFLEIEKGKAIHTHVPVHLTGSARGAREGGILEHHLHELEIECLPKDLPEVINIDVTDLELGDSIHVHEMALPSGVKSLSAPEQVIAVVVGQKPEETEEEEAEGLVAGAEGAEAEAEAEE